MHGSNQTTVDREPRPEAHFSPTSHPWLARLPAQFRATVVGVAGELLTGYPDILSLVVVGSTAEDVYDEYSDVDLLYVRETMVPKQEIIGIKSRWPLAHFIYYSPARLLEQAKTGSVQAWSIKRGMLLYDPGKIVAAVIPEVALPTRQWIGEYRQCVAGWPSDSKGLWQKALSLAVLLLAQQGVMVTTKAQLRRDFPLHQHNPLLLHAVEVVTERKNVRDRRVPEDDAVMVEQAVTIMLSQIASC